MSAQVSSGLRSLCGSTSSSSAEPVFIHTSLRETLASFSQPASASIRQLYELLSTLDHECLQHATNTRLGPAQVSTSDVEIVAELAVFLSRPLSPCTYPGTSRFQEIQLRALVSALALLQHNGVHALHPDVYDTLRLRNISARFQDIAFRVQPSSTLADRIRQAPNLYLVQLASHYVSFINRGDTPWSSVPGPIVDIFFSTLSVGGGQYQHTRNIISSLNELVNIWQRPRTKYQALCSLQEYTRLATSLCRESAITDKSNELRTAATNIVTALVDKVDEILAPENANLPPELARRWHKVVAFIGRGPPSLGQGYYYYGLLDCVSQLATVSDLSILGEGLWNRIKDLVFESVVPEFRWKAIEIILSCCCTRQEQYQMLRRDIRERITGETESILEETRIIHMHLENDEEENLRLRISQPLTRAPLIIAPEPGEPEIEGNSAESTLPRSRIKNSVSYSLRKVRKFSSSYHSAGLSSDCTHAVFNDDSEVSVYKLGDLRSRPASPEFSRVFTQKYQQRKHNECIRGTALSRFYIIIVTNKRLLVVKIQPETAIDTFPHGGWDPSGLACHESETHLVVFSGQCQRNSRSDYCGQIRVYRYRKEGQAEKLPSFVLNVPANDYPKRLSFHPTSQILTCITRLQNKLLVWKLNDDFVSSWGPYEFKKNDYTAETTEVGVTTATVYQSPSSNRVYVLCTTAPSKERWHHDGEWSFILPIPVNAARAQTHSGSCIQNLEQFQDHGPLFAGCASSQHHVLAVLEKSGRLSVLRLDKHNDGGIYSPDQDAEVLAHSLCKQDRPLTNCLRFDPSGSFLFAVDPKGKIVVTEFENE